MEGLAVPRMKEAVHDQGFQLQWGVDDMGGERKRNRKTETDRGQHHCSFLITLGDHRGPQFLWTTNFLCLARMFMHVKIESRKKSVPAQSRQI